MPYEPWMLAAIDAAGYNGITETHIQWIAEVMTARGITKTSDPRFLSAVRAAGVDPDLLSESDLEAIERKCAAESGGWF